MIRDRHVVWWSWLWMVVAWAMLAGAADAQMRRERDEDKEVSLALMNGNLVEGDFVRADEKEVVIKVNGVDRVVKVEDAHPTDLFDFRVWVIARDNPRIFIEYGRRLLTGRFADKAMADDWFRKALAVDKSLQTLIDEVRQNPDRPVDVNPHAKVEGQKFRQSDPEMEKAVLEVSEGWYRLITQRVNKTCARVETEHFLIYTTWKKADHKTLGKQLEKLYSTLCGKFDIPKDKNIWTPKMPIYCFWQRTEFERFYVEAYDRASPPAAGLCGHRLSFTYVILNQMRHPGRSVAQDRQWFYEVLVHETTHAFNNRYLSDIHLPTWFNEGIAEYMAASLVPGCMADGDWRVATRYVRDGLVDVSHNFERFGNSRLDYAVVQSMVRYMLHKKNKTKFIAFYKLLKAGKSQKEALHEAYGWDEAELIDRWMKASRRM